MEPDGHIPAPTGVNQTPPYEHRAYLRPDTRGAPFPPSGPDRGRYGIPKPIEDANGAAPISAFYDLPTGARPWGGGPRIQAAHLPEPHPRQRERPGKFLTFTPLVGAPED